MGGMKGMGEGWRGVPGAAPPAAPNGLAAPSFGRARGGRAEALPAPKQWRRRMLLTLQRCGRLSVIPCPGGVGAAQIDSWVGCRADGPFLLRC